MSDKDDFDVDELTEDEERDGYDTIMLKQPILGWHPYILVTIDMADASAELDMSLGRDVTEEVAKVLFRQAKKGVKQAEKQIMARFRAAKKEGKK